MNNRERIRERMLNGPIISSLLSIAVPIMLANILQTLYSLIDLFWVGSIGASSVAAISISFPIIFFLISFGMGISSAGAILISQYNGKNDQRMANMAFSQTTSTIFFISIAIAALGYIFTPSIASLFTSDKDVLFQTIDYMRFSFLAVPFFFLFNVFQSAFRAVGDVRVPAIIVLITLILNFFLDPLFLFGYSFIPPMGVAGVAIATLVTESLAFLIAFLIFLKGERGIKLCIMLPKIDWTKKIFSLGIPSGIEFSSRSLGSLFLTFIVSLFGTDAIASFGIGTRILSLVIIPAIGFSASTSSIVGNNLGAENFKRSEEIVKKSMTISFSSLLVFSLLLFVFSSNIVSIFIHDNNIIGIASLFIRFLSFLFPFIGVIMVINGVFKAAGMTKTAMLLSLTSTILLIVFSLIFSKLFGLVGVWASYPVRGVIVFLISYYIFSKKQWLKKIV